VKYERLRKAALILGLAAAAALMWALEGGIEPLWEARSPAPPAYLWVDRWVDVLVQALILLGTAAAVAHILREGERA